MPAGGDTATILREKTDHVVVNASTCAVGGETGTLNNTVRVFANRSPGDQAVTLDLSGGDFGVIDFFIKCSPGPSMCSYAKVALASEGG